jgi:hypothetical protein
MLCLVQHLLLKRDNQNLGKTMQQIEIRVKGEINEQWSKWFGGLAMDHPAPDETVLTGCVIDQAALYGIIARLRDLGLELTSLTSERVEEDHHEGAE